MSRPGPLARFATWVSYAMGTTGAFIFALSVVVIWALTGPIFHYSDTWQLVINTSTTIVTFLMVFLIQRTQNKDGMAIQMKLNELVAAMEGASNQLIDVEELSEKELKVIRTHYRKLVQMAREDDNVLASHSVEEAEHRHHAKKRSRKAR